MMLLHNWIYLLCLLCCYTNFLTIDVGLDSSVDIKMKRTNFCPALFYDVAIIPQSTTFVLALFEVHMMSSWNLGMHDFLHSRLKLCRKSWIPSFQLDICKNISKEHQKAEVMLRSLMDKGKEQTLPCLNLIWFRQGSWMQKSCHLILWQQRMEVVKSLTNGHRELYQ